MAKGSHGEAISVEAPVTARGRQVVDRGEVSIDSHRAVAVGAGLTESLSRVMR